MSNNVPFKLFANCIAVKGKNRSVICDLQRYNTTLIPNDLFEIIDKYENKTINEIYKIYNNEFNQTIKEYFDFLFKNEFIFFTELKDTFLKLSTYWDDPSPINNAIIDIGKESNFNIKAIISELNELNCRHLEIRFYNNLKEKSLYDFLDFIKKIESSIISINIIIPFVNYSKINSYNKKINSYNRNISIVIYNSPSNKYIGNNEKNTYVYYTKSIINSSKACGIISENLFITNTKLYTESVNHNSCLNRKISIDINGNIKNCPSMEQNFGNVKDTTLEQALNHKDFKKYWNITKDQIDVCKDCEFRHVCTDCRVYIENPKDKFSKPLKCGYSPYTNEWEEWSTNPLKQNAIEYYKLKGRSGKS